MKVLVYGLILVSFLIDISKCATCGDFDENESGCDANSECIYEDGSCKCFSSKALDVLFVVDASDSIGENPQDPNDPQSLSEWQLELEFLKYAIDSGISDNSRVGIIKFNSAVNYIVPFTYDRASIITFIDNDGMGDTSGVTHTRDAIEEAIDVFKNDNVGNQRILVLTTDGNPNPSDSQNPTTPDNLKDDLDLIDVTTVGILIGNELDRTQLELLFDDPQKEIYEVSDFSQLNLARSFLETYTCEGGPETTETPETTQTTETTEAPKDCGCTKASSRRRRLVRQMAN